MEENKTPAHKSDDMTFWGHLDELRGVLVRIAVVVIVFGVVFFIFMPWIFDNVILAPCRASFPLYKLFDIISPESTPSDFKVNLINIQLASQLFIHLSASGWMAAVFSFPVIIYLLWTFVSPALYPEEKKNSRTAFLFGNIMFYFGVAVGYFLVFPLTLRFLATYQLSDLIPNTITLDSYMDNFLSICLVMGAVFELPLVAWLLGKIGLLTRSFFNKYRRHAIVALLIVAALITPTGDPFTLFVVFLPIYMLWELSSRLVPAAKPEPEEE
ncbi:MAG: twin-arginine translocase subunit TatC [Muribaculaceae bacterium]|nr:twin-arginine translocase subunit TatC [Muribaculaceae bacterium]